MAVDEVVGGGKTFAVIAALTATTAAGVITVSRSSQAGSRVHGNVARRGLPGEIRREQAASWHLDRHYSLLATLMDSDDDAITASVAAASSGWLDD